jgi:hypothetical protein
LTIYKEEEVNTLKSESACLPPLSSPNPKAPSPTHRSSDLAGADSRAGNSVAVEVAVDVGGVTRVSALDVSGDLDTGEDLGAAASDLDLGAGVVELGRAAGVVDGHLLDAEQVVASGNARGDGGAVSLFHWKRDAISAHISMLERGAE